MPDFDDYYFPKPPRPSFKIWLKHSLFFFLTFVTVTIAGVLPPFGVYEFSEPELETWEQFFQFLLQIPSLYFQLIYSILGRFTTDVEFLRYGFKFSCSLLFILLCHEFGHYIACRIYRVDATLPFFIPSPPMIGPAGTFGAFIKMRSHLPSRNAIFDIGVAGPIAGFIALLPITLLLFFTLQTTDVNSVRPEQIEQIKFADPLLIHIFVKIFNVDLVNSAITPNPFYGAVWIGLLVTSLNLLPAGQLDGGHAVFAVFGEKIHSWIGKLSFLTMICLSGLGWYLYGFPSTVLFVILLGVLLRVPHPPPLNDTPLSFNRKIIAVITLIIFILSFVPFPIYLS